ncbi:tail tubular protein A [Acinetobacter phage APK127v]|uniref:Tail tubular protein A n=2 Tax=Friunavirus TaxID=1985711 RepID=A0A9E7LTQ0_9CAUD|nr:tail tubular protein A [Acinetobacter phage APK127v]
MLGLTPRHLYLKVNQHNKEDVLMTLLEAVNAILPYLGQHVITRVEDSRNPTVSRIVAAIDRQRKSVLAEGHWFNEVPNKVLLLNTDKTIDAPLNTLAIYGNTKRVAKRGPKLYDIDNDTRYFTGPVKVKVIYDYPFEELPEYAAQYITYLAGIEVYVSDYGMENSIQLMTERKEANRLLLVQENMRNRKWNSNDAAMRRSRFQRYLRR